MIYGSLWDLWNDPTMKVLRGGTKLAYKAVKSANDKAEHERMETPELAELLDGAQMGNSDAQVLLALYYAEKHAFDEATYWLEKSARQGNERALEIVEMLQNE